MSSASSWTLCVLIALTTVKAGEYCEDFEEGGWGSFWQSQSGSETFGGQWAPSSYDELGIEDIPQPSNGKMIIYLRRDGDNCYVGADMVTTKSYIFPEGSSVSFSYWARSEVRGTGRIQVKQFFGPGENDSTLLEEIPTTEGMSIWQPVTVNINASMEPSSIIIHGERKMNRTGNDIAVDDIQLCGPEDIDPDRYCKNVSPCEPNITTTTMTTTTTEPTTTTTELTTTTAEPTTTTTEPTTTTTEATTTTTEPTTTTTEPTTEPTTTNDPTTTTELATTSEAPTTPGLPTPPPLPSLAPDQPPEDHSSLLWAAVGVLGTSVTLLLLLAMLKRPGLRAGRLGREPFVLPVSNSYNPLGSSGSSVGSGAGGSSSSGSEASWYEYITGDPWRKMAARFGWLRNK